VGKWPPSGSGSAPTAVNDKAMTDEDTPLTIYWLTYNDTDPELDTLQVVGVTQPGHGSVVLEPDHTVTYTPAADWNGTDSFTYTITDGTSTATAGVTVTVLPVNDLPTANAISASTSEDTPVAVTLSGSDVESSTVSFFIDAGPNHGTLSDLSDNQVTYVPAGNFNGTDTFTYVAYDGEHTGAPATVTIAVSAVTDGPGVTITESGGSTRLSEPGLAAVGSGGDTYTVVLNTQPAANVIVSASPDAQLQATPSTLTFTPQIWAVPQTVTLQTIDDQVAEGPHLGTVTHSASSADAVYNGISISGVTATIIDDDFAGIDLEPSPLAGDLSEQTGSSATFTTELVSRPVSNVTVALSGAGQVSLSTGSITFTPLNWNVPQTITATAINDSAPEGYHPATVTATAASADATYQGLTNDTAFNIVDDDAPNAVPDELMTDEDVSGTVDVLANDIDAQGGTLTVTSVTQPAHGSVVVNPDGTVSYTPVANWSGVDNFSYSIANGTGGHDTGTVTVTVTPVNDPPSVTNPGPQTNAEDDEISLQITATDLEQSSFLYTAADLPPGLVIDPMTGKIWGWIDPQAAGTYGTSVSVDDFAGGVTTVNFTWTVTDTNHAPYVYRWHGLTTNVGQGGGIGGIINASDIDGDELSLSMSGMPPGVTYDPVTNTMAGTPSAAGTYTLTMSASDGHGGSAQRQFAWNVLPIGVSAPIALVDIGDGESNKITLAYPAAPLEARVTLYFPNDPSTPYDVSLVVDHGRATVDTPVVTLRDGETATVLLYPAGVSQQVEDATLHAFVAGRETCLDTFTIVGVTLPYRVRGADTPEGMKDRISLGAGNWGSYTGVVTMSPNLKGVQSIGLTVTRPEEDDKYGNAILDALDVERLMLAGRSVVKVIGTVQTAPNPDVPGGNAGMLKLQAQIFRQNGGLVVNMNNGFAAAAIPIAVKASNATARSGMDVTLPDGTHLGWFWGVQYKLEAQSDGGALDKVQIAERFEIGLSSGMFNDIPLVVGTWGPANQLSDDLNGLTDSVNKNLADARKQLQEGLDALEGVASKNEEQAFYFYDSRTEEKPNRIRDGHVVKESGFWIYTFTAKKPAALLIERKALEAFSADPGILDKTGAGQKKVVI
jgi:Bacterial Ig domain/Putative Ig domain